MEDKRWYEILGLPELADTDAVKKAFRQMSLKHHPDKGGDVDKFHELQQASQYLLDPLKKKEYDTKIMQVTMQDKQRKERVEKMNDERKRMADELLKRENATEKSKRPKHVMEDFKEKAKQRMEDLRMKRDQEYRDRAELLGKSQKKGDIKQRTIRVSWDNKKESHSDQTLVNSFRIYGEIEVVKMKSHSARIVFTQATSATQAARIEGHNNSKWKDVTLVGHAVHQKETSTSPHETHPEDLFIQQLELHPISMDELTRFEAQVFRHLETLSSK